MKNILVTIDFEEKTKDLLNNAKQLAKKFGSKVWIIHIVEHQTDIVGYPDSFQYGVQYMNIREERAEELKKEHKLVQEYSNQLIKAGIDSEALLIEGPTVKVILDEAIKLKIDMIIIGSHKHSFLYNALIESTEAALIRKSNIPILVVPLNT
jgi:nucleotide-binding universal stress UspA family protein